MKDTLGGLWSYSVAGISAYMAHIGPAECWQFIMSACSAVLLVCRLYVDVPKALRKWRARHD